MRATKQDRIILRVDPEENMTLLRMRQQMETRLERRLTTSEAVRLAIKGQAEREAQHAES